MAEVEHPFWNTADGCERRGPSLPQSILELRLGHIRRKQIRYPEPPVVDEATTFQPSGGMEAVAAAFTRSDEMAHVVAAYVQVIGDEGTVALARVLLGA